MDGSEGPLAGCVMVITADRRSRELASALERRGATVMHAPALTVVPHLNDERLIADTRALLADPPDIVVATTGVGFRGWIEAADAVGLAEPLLALLAKARIIARGPKAVGAIQAAGLAADWVAESETAAEIERFLVGEGIRNQRIAVQHHGNGSDGLDEAFTAAGAQVVSLVVYGWGPPLDPAAHASGVEAAASGRCDAVIFTSAPGVEAWLETAVDLGLVDVIRDRVRDGRLVLASVGPVTAAPLLARGLPSVFPDRWRLGALVRTLVDHYASASHPIPTVAGPLQLRATAAILGDQLLALTPAGLAILAELARAGGAVVSGVDLAAVVPGASSNPHAMEAAIARLREACGSKAIIRTVVKRGYALATGSFTAEETVL